MNYKNAIAAVAVAVCASLLQVPQAVAADIPAAKVVTVDVQKVVKNASAAKRALDEIKKQRDEFQTEINKQEESLKKKDQDLTKQKGVLSAEAFEQKRKALQKDILTVQQGVQKKRSVLDAGYNKVLAEIQKNVLDIIKTLAKERGFDVALPSSQVLYSNEALDVSDEVLKRLNDQLPKVSIDVEEPKEQKGQKK